MTSPKNDSTLNSISSQLTVLEKSIDYRLQIIESNLANYSDLQEEKLNHLKCSLKNIESLIKDHEDRIRFLDDTAITLKSSFKTIQALQAALTLIAAAIAAWLGSK